MIPTLPPRIWNKARYKRWLRMLTLDRAYLERMLSDRLYAAERCSRTFPSKLFRYFHFHLMDDILAFDQQYLQNHIHNTFHRNT